MPNSAWQNVPEDILFLVLGLIDADDANELYDQSDWLNQSRGKYPWNINYVKKPGLQDVQLVCSTWRSIGIAAKAHFPLWMTILTWGAWADTRFSEDDTKAAKIALLKYGGNTDYGIRGFCPSFANFELLKATILEITHHHVCFLWFWIGHHVADDINLHLELPKLTKFGLLGSAANVVHFKPTPMRLERLDVPAIGAFDELVSFIQIYKCCNSEFAISC
jgi:hypothetical protein